jgi:hypothetical protein
VKERKKLSIIYRYKGGSKEGKEEGRKEWRQ